MIPKIRLFKHLQQLSLLGFFILNSALPSPLRQADYPLPFSILPIQPAAYPVSTLEFTLTFSQPVSGLDSTDFALQLTPLSDPNPTPPAVTAPLLIALTPLGAGDAYSLTVDTAGQSGWLTLTLLDDDTILNAAGIPLGGTGPGNGALSSAPCPLFQLPVTPTAIPPTLTGLPATPTEITPTPTKLPVTPTGLPAIPTGYPPTALPSDPFFSESSYQPLSTLPAFPGAEGFGSFATGGRGGSVIYVTNTNASGVGSLQWAIDQPGKKYILFKVSGLINSQIHLTNGDVTIAGQTSPGGITLRGFVTDETPFQDQAVQAPADYAQNWILQHVRIRPGLGNYSDDGLRLRYTRNGIVDHVSIGNATDEEVEISFSNNLTVQNSILAETLGDHALYGGMLINYSNPAYGFKLDNVSIHHNIFNRIQGRLPEGSRESPAAANSTMNLEVSNNLYWDPRYFIVLSPNTNIVTNGSGNPYPIYWNLNVVNNYFRTASNFIYGMWDDQILRETSAPGNYLFISGNQMNLYPTRSDYALFYCCNDYPTETNPDTTSRLAHKRTSRHPFPAITYTPTSSLRQALLNTVGAWPRDPMDTRLLLSVSTNTISPAASNTNPANDALLLPYNGTPPAAPLDSDNDGMPNTWEVSKGLNPNVANQNGTTLSTLGYTDLEVYLHELSAALVNPVRPAAFSKSAPLDGVTGASLSPTLSWASSTGASRYEVCYDTTNDNACTTWTSVGASLSRKLTGLAGNTTYYWQVRAVNSIGTTYANASAGTYWSFRTGTPPAAFNKSAPLNAATGISLSPTLSWAYSTGASRYEVCYDTTNDNACTTWTSVGTSRNRSLTGLAHNTKYYWQVRAVNSISATYANNGAYYSFTTLP